MPRAAWQGYIALGQLGIPVRLYSATQATHPPFVQLHEKDGSPVQRVLQCRDEHKQISLDEVVRAVEHTPGYYITLTDQELEQAISSELKTINIQQFADLDAIEPIYFEKPYYIVPGRGGERAYALLREVFVRSHKMAITQFVIHNKQHIGALAVQGDLLVLYQLRFASEILPRTNVRTPPLPKPSPAEISALTSVVERFSGPLYIQDYHDEYAERINLLVERKSKGLATPKRERIAPHATPEGEIVSALQDTLDNQGESAKQVKSNEKSLT